LRRRVAPQNQNGVDSVEAVSRNLLFPCASLPGTPTIPTMVGDQNIAEEFVRAVSLHVSEVPEIRLVARNEKVAAVAIHNYILQEANKRYNANVPPVVVNHNVYEWTSVVPTSYRALFRKDFNLML
jgi:hypothetical protein